MSTEMKMIEDLGAIYPKDTSLRKRHYAIYECPFCGAHKKASVENVKQGNTKSCGCAMRFLVSQSKIKYNDVERHLDDVWYAMLSRCYNINSSDYKHYGGRGITVCKEWLDDKLVFIRWSLNHGYQNGLEIDRVNNDGGYSPENCRWASHRTNSKNRGLRSDNTSGYVGVSRKGNKWYSYIFINKQICLGLYQTPEEAAIAYNDFVIKHNTGHRLNKI